MIIEVNKIYNMDCAEGLRLMEKQGLVADWLITDPPYGLGIDGQEESICKNPKHNRKAHDFEGWDSEIPDKSVFDAMFKQSKNQIIFGANYFTTYLPPGHKGWVIWDKGQRGLSMSDCEIIFVSSDAATRIVTYNRAQLIKDGGTIHPTQKPIALICDLINRFTKPGDLILDCFSGSAAIPVACHKLQRRFIAFEKSPNIYDKSVKRFNVDTAQTSIFDIY